MNRIEALSGPAFAQNGPQHAARSAFVARHLLVGGVALALVPALLALGGRLAPGETLALIGVLTAFGSIALIAAGRPLWQGQIAASAGLAGAGAILMTGGAMLPGGLMLCAALLDVFASRDIRQAAIMAAPTCLAVLAAVALGGPASETAAGTPAGLSAWSLAFWCGLALAHGIVAAAQAISAARQRDSASRALETAATLMAERLNVAVLTVDAGGCVTSISPNAEPALGLRSRDLMGLNLFHRLHVGDRPVFLTHVSTAVRDRHPSRLTIRLARDSDTCRDTCRDGETQRAHYTTFTVDIAPASETAVSGGILLIRVDSENTAQAVADAAEQDDEDARDNAKAKFLATVSHELRTPLNAIIGFAEMLASPDLCPTDPARRCEYAGIIHTSGVHLLDIVNTLLDVSRIESGAFELRREAFDMSALARSCRDMVALKAAERGVRLNLDISPALPVITADRRACGQVIINLLSNAVKFSEPGGRVDLCLRSAGNGLLLSVEDDGVGIAEKDLSRLGDPFFQAEQAYDRRYEGTGLGLSVVRGIVGLHGGDIALDSAPGRGTRVMVRLPLTPDTARGDTGTTSLSPRITVSTRRPDIRAVA